MAVVELAEDVELHRTVAVKLLADNLAHDDEVRRRFLREARLAAGISHPNVVRIFDAGEHDRRPYFVMEHVEGETLAQLVAREGRLRPQRAVALAVQAARGLEAAHAAGLVHRDVKPHNLLLRTDGVLKVTDFGIARAQEGTQLTAEGTVLGTAGYVAPEQLAGGPVTVASDVYGLGAVVYELLTGRPPRSAATLAELGSAGPIRAPSRIARGISPELERIVMRCLADEPARRPTSAAEVAAELDAAVEAVTPTATEAPTRRLADAVTRPLAARAHVSRRARLTLALAAAALLLIALGLGLALGLRGGDGGSPRPAQTPPLVTPVPHSDDAAQQARNLSTWLRRWSAGG